MSLGALVRLPLAVAQAVLAALRGRLGALCWSLSPLFLSLPSWRRVSAHSPADPAGPRGEREWDDPSPTPTSVNYHFTRQCNYKCGFCFHTAKTSFVLPLEEAKRGLAMLKEAGECGEGAGDARRPRPSRTKWRRRSYPCPEAAAVPLHIAAVGH